MQDLIKCKLEARLYVEPSLRMRRPPYLTGHATAKLGHWAYSSGLYRPFGVHSMAYASYSADCMAVASSSIKAGPMPNLGS